MNDFERILISSLSHNPTLLPAVSSIVSPEHFESPEAADIYAQMLTRQAFDPSTVERICRQLRLTSWAAWRGCVKC